MFARLRANREIATLPISGPKIGTLRMSGCTIRRTPSVSFFARHQVTPAIAEHDQRSGSTQIIWSEMSTRICVGSGS